MTSEYDTLAQLLDSCASITSLALSCRTLGNPVTAELQLQISREVDKAKWLDCQIAKCRATLRRKKRPREDGQQVESKKRLQLKLFDEAVHRQQEVLLWERIRMSTEAQTQMTGQEGRESHAVLVREAVVARDKQVEIVLKKRKEREEAHRDEVVQDIEKQCRMVQEENGKLLQEIRRNEEIYKATSTADGTENKRTKMVQRALQDLIIGSGLDLHDDSRLLETVMKLERTST